MAFRAAQPQDALGDHPTSLRESLVGQVLKLRSCIRYPEEHIQIQARLERLQGACSLLSEDSYCMPLHLFIAIEYLGLGYPDLAIGSAYKSMMLYDAIQQEGDEYHEQAMASIRTFIGQIPAEERQRTLERSTSGIKLTDSIESNVVVETEVHTWMEDHLGLILYRIFVRSLVLCDCFRSAHTYLSEFLKTYPKDIELLKLNDDLNKATSNSDPSNVLKWTDGGFVRRELYPWNAHEPDRLQELDALNSIMSKVSRKLEVCAVELPALNGEPGGMVTQLGVFTKEDVNPGEVVLDETSLLTANNKLQDALCDACSADLPDLATGDAQNVVACPECDVVFCSQSCFQHASDCYHPALCDKDVEAIAKDVTPEEAADSLYALLLLRTFALAETQNTHPLDLHEVKYIWGDFSPQPAQEQAPYLDNCSVDNWQVPRTLPFSFRYNVELPFHMLEKMDIDIFARPEYDVWVFNTLYAKFRGTASARLSGLGGRAIRGPEVSAVHPMWCLANHSCDPNVSWEWGGSIKFWARETRAGWQGSETKVHKRAGIKKGEEVLNHYCDIELPVEERRAWSKGALGGDCQCERCVWEAKHKDIKAGSKGS